MTNEEAIIELKDASDSEVRYGDTERHYNEVMKRVEAFDVAIKALEQQSCEDCISRESTVKRLCKVGDFMNEKRSGLGSPYIMAALFIQDNKDEFPSVTPTRPTGKWEFVQYDYNPNIGNWHCSECMNIVTNKEGGIPKYEYCPSCGARMVESEDEA